MFIRIAKDGKSFPYQPQLGSIIGVATQAKIISLHCMVILDLELVPKTPKTALLVIVWSFLILNWCQKLLKLPFSIVYPLLTVRSLCKAHCTQRNIYCGNYSSDTCQLITRSLPCLASRGKL